MAKYAENTTVSVESSQMEIKRVCIKYGAAGFMVGDHATIGGGIEFEMRGRRLRFRVRYPDPKDHQFTHIDRYHQRSPAAAKAKYEAECRRLWRVLLLTIKSKCESVENGLVNFDEEWLPFIVVPGENRTIGELLVPQIDEVYRTGQLPPLLGSGMR